MQFVCLEQTTRLSTLLSQHVPVRCMQRLENPEECLDFPDWAWFISDEIAPSEMLPVLAAGSANSGEQSPGRIIVYDRADSLKPYLESGCGHQVTYLPYQTALKGIFPFKLQESASTDSQESPQWGTQGVAIRDLEWLFTACDIGLQAAEGQKVFLQWLASCLRARVALLYLQDGDGYRLQEARGLPPDSVSRRLIPDRSILCRVLKERQSFLALPRAGFPPPSPSPAVQSLLEKMGMQAACLLGPAATAPVLVLFGNMETGSTADAVSLAEIERLASFCWSMPRLPALPGATPGGSGATTPLVLDQPETLLQQFAGRTANEFKNTLVPIKTFTQLLPEKFKDPHFRKDFFKVMTREVHRLEELMDTVGFFASKQVPDPGPLDVRDWIQKALEIYKEQYPRVQFQISVPDGALQVQWDMGQMTKALRALVKNAAQAMEGHGTVTLVIHEEKSAALSRIGEQVTFTLTDEGRFPEAAVASRMHEPLFSTKPNGLGLGLTVAKAVIEAHGGHLEASEGENGGTCFRWTVPKHCQPLLTSLQFVGSR